MCFTRPTAIVPCVSCGKDGGGYRDPAHNSKGSISCARFEWERYGALTDIARANFPLSSCSALMAVCARCT
jgi:hypothetical protein